MIRHKLVRALLAVALLASSAGVFASTEIQFWHAFTGRLGDLVAEQVNSFNASQNDYKVVASHKGTRRWRT